MSSDENDEYGIAKKFYEGNKAASEALLNEFEILRTNGQIWSELYKPMRIAASNCKKAAAKKRDNEIKIMEMHRIPVSDEQKEHMYRTYIEELKPYYGFEQDGFS